MAPLEPGVTGSPQEYVTQGVHHELYCGQQGQHIIPLGSYQGIPIKISKNRVRFISDTTHDLGEIIKNNTKLGRNTAKPKYIARGGEIGIHYTPGL